MVATVVEHRVGDVRWTVVRGPREAAFRALGAAAADDIRTVLAGLPGWPVIARTRRSPVLFRAIESASQVEHPDAYAELAALAEGAGVPFDDLLLANLRGDMAPATAPAAPTSRGPARVRRACSGTTRTARRCSTASAGC